MKTFPVPVGDHRPLSLTTDAESLSPEVLAQLKSSIQLGRDAIVFFTAYAQARGLGGHTGGAYDILPEALLADAFMRGNPGIVPEFFDEAGHRVALQYLLSVFNGHMPAEKLFHYREAGHRLPGHPERDFTPGVTFSSGRLGHLWSYVNGISQRERERTVLLFGSDGSQQEGNNAEAARFAVAHRLNVKLLIDDNDVTISGHPSAYLKGYSVAKTLYGHGLSVQTVDGEDLQALYRGMCWLLTTPGPCALVCKRPMAPGIVGIEGSPHGHDAIAVPLAIQYLEARGHQAAVAALKEAKPVAKAGPCRGSTTARRSVRKAFGTALSEVLTEASAEARRGVLVIDNDLEGSCGLAEVKKQHPSLHLNAGIMERGNYSLAAGFGREHGQQGVYATFSAFLEMLHSEIAMARLNESHVLAHFSHAGVAEIVDNTCHFGVNNFFADSGLGADDPTRLYFPADSGQMRAVVRRVFGEAGLRFVFSPRCDLPDILGSDNKPLFGDAYQFQPGVDDVVRPGTAGWIVSYGDCLHLAVDAAETLREQGIEVGVLNKASANLIDEQAMQVVGKSRFVLVVESQNVKTGLGVRFGTWLLERGLSPRFARLGVHLRGEGGTIEQMVHQGLDSASIAAAVRKLAQ